MYQAHRLGRGWLPALLAGALAVALLATGSNVSAAGDGQTSPSKPVVKWARLYPDYRDFRQLQDAGGGESVALATQASSTQETGADVHLVKFSVTGDIVWDRTYGGAYSDLGNSLTKTKDGGFLICGNSQSFREAGDYLPEIYLLKTDSEGILQWQRTYGGDLAQYGWFAREREGGGYLIFGYIGAKDITDDHYIAVTDEAGKVVSEHRFSGGQPLFDVDQQIRNTYGNGHPTQDGGCILHTGTDLIRVTADGEIMWQRDFASYDTTPKIRDAIQTSDSNFACVVIGASARKSGLIRLDSKGSQISTASITEGSYLLNSYSSSLAIRQDSDQGLVFGVVGDGAKRVAKFDETGKMAWSLFTPKPGPGTGGYVDILSTIGAEPESYIACGVWISTDSYHPEEWQIHQAYLARIEMMPQAMADPSSLDYR